MTDTTPKTRTHTFKIFDNGQSKRERDRLGQGPKFSFCTAYYKWNMYWHVLNFDFQNFHNDSVDMIVYKETMESRGSQVVASCCKKHLKKVTTQKHATAYSA